MDRERGGPGGPDVGGSPSAWEQSNRAVDHLIRRHGPALAPVFSLARDLAKAYAEVFPTLESLCRRTCSRCPAPCCLSAKVWFDLPDLLFLHFAGCVVPPGQPLSRREEICRYSGPKGCRLDRFSRPWICTWYLCPVQTAVLRRDAPDGGEGHRRAVAGIKAYRRRMERRFIRLTAGAG